jgi:hypothetical protein
MVIAYFICALPALKPRGNVHEITDTSYVRLRFIKVVSKVTVMRWGRAELTYVLAVWIRKTN